MSHRKGVRSGLDLAVTGKITGTRILQRNREVVSAFGGQKFLTAPTADPADVIGSSVIGRSFELAAFTISLMVSYKLQLNPRMIVSSILRDVQYIRMIEYR